MCKKYKLTDHSLSDKRQNNISYDPQGIPEYINIIPTTQPPLPPLPSDEELDDMLFTSREEYSEFADALIKALDTELPEDGHSAEVPVTSSRLADTDLGEFSRPLYRFATRVLISVLSRMSTTEHSRNTALFVTLRTVCDAPDRSFREKLSGIIDLLDQYSQKIPLPDNLRAFREQLRPVLALLKTPDNVTASDLLSVLGGISLLPAGMVKIIELWKVMIRQHDVLSSLPEDISAQAYLRAVMENAPESIQDCLDILRELCSGTGEMYRIFDTYQSGQWTPDSIVNDLRPLLKSRSLRAVLPQTGFDVLTQISELSDILIQLVSCKSLPEFTALLDDARISRYLPDWAPRLTPLVKTVYRLGYGLNQSGDAEGVPAQLLGIFDVLRVGAGSGAAMSPEITHTLDAFHPYAECFRTLLHWKKAGAGEREFRAFLKMPELKIIAPRAVTDMFSYVDDVLAQVAQARQLYTLYQSGQLTGSALLGSLNQAAKSALASGLLGEDRAVLAQNGFALLQQLLFLTSSTSVTQLTERLNTPALDCLLSDDIRTGIKMSLAFLNNTAPENTEQPWLEWIINTGDTAGKTVPHQTLQAGLDVALPFFRLLKSLRDWSAEGSLNALGQLFDSGALQSVMTQESAGSLTLLSEAARKLSALYASDDESRLAAVMQLFDSPGLVKYLAPYLPDWVGIIGKLIALFNQFPSEDSAIMQAEWLFRIKDELRQEPGLKPLVTSIEQSLGWSDESAALLNNLLHITEGDRWAVVNLLWSFMPATESIVAMLGYLIPGLKPVLDTGVQVWRAESETLKDPLAMSTSDMLSLSLRVMRRVVTSYDVDIMKTANHYMMLFDIGLKVMSGQPWHEVLRTASSYVQTNTDKALFIGAVLLPFCGWKISCALSQAGGPVMAAQAREDLRQVKVALTEYLPVASVSALNKVISLLPWLPTLRALLHEKGTLPETGSYTAWLKGMLNLLATSTAPEIVSLRIFLEEQAADAIGDLLVNGSESTTWVQSRDAVSGGARAAGQSVTTASGAVNQVTTFLGYAHTLGSALWGKWQSTHHLLNLPTAAAGQDNTFFTASHVREAIVVGDMVRAAERYQQLSAEERTRFAREAQYHAEAQQLTQWMKTRHDETTTGTLPALKGDGLTAGVTKNHSETGPGTLPPLSRPSPVSGETGSALRTASLVTGVSLGTVGPALIAWGLWQAKRAGKQVPVTEETEMLPLGASRAADENTDITERTSMTAQQVTQASPTLKSRLWEQKIPLLLGLLATAAGAGGVGYYAGTQTAATGDGAQDDDEKEYQQILVLFDEIVIPDLGFLFNEAISDEINVDISTTDHPQESMITTPELLKRGKRYISFSEQRLRERINKMLQNNGLKNDPYVKALLASADKRVRKQHPGYSPQAKDLMMLVYAIFIAETRKAIRKQSVTTLLAELWRIARSLTSDYEIHIVNYLSTMLNNNTTLLTSGTTPSPSLPEVASMPITTEILVQKALQVLDNTEHAYAATVTVPGFIDKKINDGIRAYENRTGKITGMKPDSKVTITIRGQYKVEGALGLKPTPKIHHLQFTLRDVITGQYLYDIKQRKDENGRDYLRSDISYGIQDRPLLDSLTADDLQDNILTAIRAYRNDIKKKDAVKSLYLDQIRANCIIYLEAPENRGQDTVFTRAVNDFLEGTIQAQTVKFDGHSVNDVYLIPAGDGGLLFSVDGSLNSPLNGVPATKKKTIEIMEKAPLFKGGNPKMDVNAGQIFPQTQEFKDNISRRLPASVAYTYRDTPPQKFQINKTTVNHSDYGNVDMLSIITISPRFSFTDTRNQEDLSEQLFTGWMNNLEADADYLIFSQSEQNHERYMEGLKSLLMFLGTLLGMAIPGAGSLISRIGLIVADLAITTGYVLATLEQSKQADRQEDKDAYLHEAMFAGILGGITAIPGAISASKAGIMSARTFYRQARVGGVFTVEAHNLFKTIMGKANWTRLDNIRKIDLLLSTAEKRPVAQTLAQMTNSQAVGRAIANLLKRNASGLEKTTFAWRPDIQSELRQIDYQLESDTYLLNSARRHMQNIMADPLEETGTPLASPSKESIAAWWVIHSVMDDDASLVPRPLAVLRGIFSDYKDVDLLDIANIDAINNKLHPAQAGTSAFIPSGNFQRMGTDISYIGFEKALNDIRMKKNAGVLASKDIGATLYAAVMRYKPYNIHNKETARTLYALSRLKVTETNFSALSARKEAYLEYGWPQNPNGIETMRILPEEVTYNIPADLKAYFGELRSLVGGDSSSFNLLPEVRDFMARKGMQDIKVRKILFWKNIGIPARTHYALRGKIDEQDIIIDLTGERFLEKDSGLNIPMILPEPMWAKSYQQAFPSRTWLVKYKDFDSITEAYHGMGGHTPRPIGYMADSTMTTDGAFRLTEPLWVKPMEAPSGSKTLGKTALNELAVQRQSYLNTVSMYRTLGDPEQFSRGEKNPSAITLSGINEDMSELDLIKKYFADTTTDEQDGALYRLIDNAHRGRIIGDALKRAGRYSQILGETSSRAIIAPQNFLLADMGPSLPLVMSTAVALSNNREITLFKNLYRSVIHTDAPGMRGLMALDILNDIDRHRYLTPVTLRGSQTVSIGDITDELAWADESRFFCVESKTHTMMVGVTPRGARKFHFYDPTVGLFSYSSIYELKQALTRTIGAEFMGIQYESFGTEAAIPLYRLSRIDTDVLKKTELSIPGTKDPVTVASLSSREVDPVVCIASGSMGLSKRALTCGELDEAIVKIEKNQERMLEEEKVQEDDLIFSMQHYHSLQEQLKKLDLHVDKKQELLSTAYQELQTARLDPEKVLSVQQRAIYTNYMSSLIDMSRVVREALGQGTEVEGASSLVKTRLTGLERETAAAVKVVSEDLKKKGKTSIFKKIFSQKKEGTDKALNVNSDNDFELVTIQQSDVDNIAAPEHGPVRLRKPFDYKRWVTNSEEIVVYRQDQRSLQEIIDAGGFYPRTLEIGTLEDHALGSTKEYSFVSTSDTRLKGGSYGKYEYKIRLNPHQAVNLPATLDRIHGNPPKQYNINEYSVPGFITPSQIIGWREW